MPVVATDSGGVTEILGPEPAGVGAVVPVDDPAALADAIVDVLERRATFDPVAMHRGIAARFGSEAVAARWNALYREVLDEAAGPSTTVAATTERLATPTGRRIVVALDRESARRQLAGLPSELRDRLWLLTARDPASIEIPATGRVETVVVDAAWRGAAGSTRSRRVLSDPVAALRRAVGRDAGSPSAIAPASRLLRDLLAAAGPGARAIPVDGHDFLVVADAARGRPDVLDPSGVAGLADAWLERDAD
jgi:hypothetical protein